MKGESIAGRFLSIPSGSHVIWSTVHNRQHLSDFVLLSLFFIFLQAPPPGLNPKPAFSIHTERWMGKSIALALEITQTVLFFVFLGGGLWV